MAMTAHAVAGPGGGNRGNAAPLFSLTTHHTHQEMKSMITLHRLGHAVDAFQINPDVILTVEATPDTVITIMNGQKIVVAEPPERVADEIQEYRATVLAQALIRRHELRAEGGMLRRVAPLRKPSSVQSLHAVSDGHQTA
jgi:uncharacterized protein YlzI (FlbEa/FlbD family)